MYTFILGSIISLISFIGGIYFERVNSISKVKPIKKAFRSINVDRTIVVDRSNK